MHRRTARCRGGHCQPLRPPCEDAGTCARPTGATARMAARTAPIAGTCWAVAPRRASGCAPAPGPAGAADQRAAGGGDAGTTAPSHAARPGCELFDRRPGIDPVHAWRRPPGERLSPSRSSPRRLHRRPFRLRGFRRRRLAAPHCEAISAACSASGGRVGPAGGAGSRSRRLTGRPSRGPSCPSWTPVPGAARSGMLGCLRRIDASSQPVLGGITTARRAGSGWSAAVSSAVFVLPSTRRLVLQSRC